MENKTVWRLVIEQFISVLCEKNTLKNCTKCDISIRVILYTLIFFTKQRSETSLEEQGYIAMSNVIKIENVGIFYPFPVVAVRWLLCKRSLTYHVSILGYAYALHFSASDRLPWNFNPLWLFTSKHNCLDSVKGLIYLSGKKHAIIYFYKHLTTIFLEYENVLRFFYND